MDTQLDHLRRLYIDERKTRSQIAAVLAVSEATVSRLLSKHGLVGRRASYANLAGKVFGSLVAIQYLRSERYAGGGKVDVWLCKCQCGDVIETRSCNLKSGHSTKCRKCADQDRAERSRKCPIDYGVWYRITQRCRERGIDLNVTAEELKEVFVAQDARCALTGIPIFFGKRRCDESTASPDRIDPRKGYIKGNVRWVHKFVNSMRNDKSDEEFIEWCQRVVNYANHKQ